MAKSSTYVSPLPDASGRVPYSEAEHAIWAELYARQTKAIEGRACGEFLHGLELLALPNDRVPQLAEVSQRLRRETGWEVARVPALIPFSEFFALLADRKFPAATFVRRREDLDYLQEPDIFHEIFGHTPLLTNSDFAAFTEAYGKLGLAAAKEDRVFLARLYWFTVEFGLIGRRITPADQRPPVDGGAGLSEQAGSPATDGSRPSPDKAHSTHQNLKIYGGGILSSIGETGHALSGQPLLRPFDLIEVLRTPYRIDVMQPLYYVLESLAELKVLTRIDLMACVEQAKRLGLHAPLYPPKDAPTPNTLRAA